MALTNWRQGGQINRRVLFFGDSTTPDVSTGGVAPDFDVLMRAVVGQFGQQLGTAIFQNGGTSGATLQQVLTDTVAGGRGITWVCSQDYDVIFIRYDINGIRVGGRNAAALTTDLLTLVAAIHSARPYADIVLHVPNSFLTTDVNGSGFVSGVTPQAATTILRDGYVNAYTSLVGSGATYINLLDTQADIFGTTCVPNSQKMRDQIHPSAEGYVDICYEVGNFLAKPGFPFQQGVDPYWAETVLAIDGTGVFDRTGRHTLTVTGSVVPDGKGALAFTAASPSYLVVGGNLPDFDFGVNSGSVDSGNAHWFIEGWVKRTPGGNQPMCLIGNQNGTGSWGIYLNDAANNYTLSMSGSGNPSVSFDLTALVAQASMVYYGIGYSDDKISCYIATRPREWTTRVVSSFQFGDWNATAGGGSSPLVIGIPTDFWNLRAFDGVMTKRVTRANRGGDQLTYLAPDYIWQTDVPPAVVTTPRSVRPRGSSTFDYSNAGWFNKDISGGGIFDVDMAGVSAAPPGSYSLTAAQGSFSLTGQSAALKAGRQVVAAQGSFALTGRNAGLLRSLKLTAVAGSYSLNGQTANLAHSFKVSAAFGTYVLSGQVAALKFGHVVAAGQGSFALTGQNVAFVKGLRLTAAFGSYSLAGQPVSFPRTYRLSSAAGSFTLSGQAAGLQFGHRLAAGQGAYTLTGIAAALKFGHRLAAAQGSFALSGQTAGLPLSRKLTAAAGTYALTGYAAALFTARTMSAAAGAFSLTGSAAVLRRGYTLQAGAGAYVLTGQAIAFSGLLSLPAQAGSFSLTGQAIGLRSSRKLTASAGSFSLGGQTANMLRGRTLAAAPGSFALTGQAAALRLDYLLSALAGAFALTGRAVNLTYSSGIDYGAIAAAVWAFVLPNGKTAAETAVETLELLEAMSAAPGPLDVPIEGSLTGADLLKIIAAVQAGKTTIESAAPGTAHVEFTAVDGTDVRVAADMTGSERTDVSITL